MQYALLVRFTHVHSVLPVLTSHFQGDDISEGILAWTVIGVDLTTSYSVTPAYNFTSDGGIEVDDGSGGLPTGGAGGPSGSASGELPSGTPPSRRFVTE